jgi:hypothetical protein
MANGDGTAPGWAESNTSGGDLQGIVMQIARLFAQMIPAMMGAPGPAAQAARFGMYGGMADLVGGSIGPRARGREMMGMGIMGAMQDVTGAGGAQAGGFGMGAGAAEGMMGGLGGQGGMVGTGSQQMTPGEFGGMMGMAGQGGFFKGVSDIRAARRQMQDLVRTVTTLHHELNLTVETVMSDLATMRQAGGFTNVGQAASAFRSTIATATMGGMGVDQALQQYIAPAAQQLRVAARIPMASAYEAARQGLQTVAGAARAGYISEEALFNSTGMGGEQGAMALTGQIQAAAMRQANSTRMNYMMAAALDPRTGQISHERVQQLMSGQMSVGDITNLAGQNISQVGGLAAWQQMQPQVRGQFMEQTGGMGMLALANTAAQAAAPNDPNLQQAYFQRLSGAQDPMQAQAFRMAMGSWGAMQERAQNVQAHIDQQAQAGARMTERAQYADLSNVVGAAVEQVTGGVMNRFDDALKDMSSAATDLLTGYTEPASAGAGYSASLTRGAAADFYRGISPERRGGAFVNLQQYVSQGRERVDAFRTEADRSGGAAGKALGAAATQMEKLYQSGAAGATTQTSEYWRGDVGALTMSQGTARQQMGLGGEAGAAEQEYTRTRAGRLGMLSMYGQAVAMVGSEEDVQKKLMAAAGMPSGSKWQGTAVEMLQGRSADQMRAVVKTLAELSKQTIKPEEMGTVGQAWLEASNAAQAFGGGKWSLGQMDIATGAGPGVTDAILAQRRAIQSGQTALGGFGTGGLAAASPLTSLFQQNTELMGQVGSWLKGAGKEWKGGTLGQLLSGAGITGERQKEIFGEDYLKMTVGSASKMVTWLEDSMVAGSRASKDEILTAGVLGETAYKKYEEVGKERGEGGRVARALGAARRRFAEGDVGGLVAAGDEITRLANVQDNKRFRQGLAALEPSAAERVAQYRQAIRSGGGLSVEEARATGAVSEEQIRGALGEGLYGLVKEGGGRLSREKQREVSSKLQDVVSAALVNVSAGRQGDPGQPTGPGAAAASSGLASALADAMGQVPEIRVRVVNPGEIGSGKGSTGSGDQVDTGGATQQTRSSGISWDVA